MVGHSTQLKDGMLCLRCHLISVSERFQKAPTSLERFVVNMELTQGNETLFPNWQKELWQTFEETAGYVRPERVNKWPNCMTDDDDDDDRHLRYR
jgi:hypothetical protein